MDHKKIPVLGFIIDWMVDSDMDYGPLVAMLAFLLFLTGLFMFGVAGGQILSIVIALAPIWLPLALFFIFFEKWMDMVGNMFYLNQGRATLRIHIPQEIFKSPEAMETVLAQVHNTASPDNLMQTYLQGKRPLPMSLEIVSIGGDVRFYVNLKRKQSRDAFEANMYAQYPGIEIVEEPVDYTAEIPLDTKEHDIMSFHMAKKEQEEFPLKSYIDFGLTNMPKEEEKIDPITPTLEVLSNIKPYERMYIQFICVAYRKDSFMHGQLIKSKSWKDRMSGVVDGIMRRDPKTKGPIIKENKAEGESDFEGMPRITPGERSVIEMLERHSGKYVYKTAVRWMYITKKGHFNGDLINPMIRIFSAYDGMNGLGVRWRTDFDYKNLFPGKKEKQINALKRQELREYKLRKYDPKAGSADDWKMFSVEELATVFHLPGRVALTPGLARIPSTRSEAPPNLPTGNAD